MRLTKIFLALTTYLIIFSCSDTGEFILDNSEDTLFVDFTSLDITHHDKLKVTLPSTYVFNDSTEFLVFWDRYCSAFDSYGNKSSPPDINFLYQTLIGVFWGDSCRYSGPTNFGDAIESVYIFRDTLFVDIGDLKIPGFFGACILPSHLILINKITIPVKFMGNIPK